MHREALNQEIMNASNFMIVPIVVAIVYFLIVHPCNSACSASVGIANLYSFLPCP